MTTCPSFSVIVPTYNRPEALRRCLEALAGLDYPADRVEIIVVDDGGEADLSPVLAALQGNVSLRLVRQDNAGPAQARNNGVAHARGEYVAFTDDDCAPDPSWLRHFGRALSETPEALVGGRVHNALPHNPYAEASQLLVTYLYTHHDERQHDGLFFTSNNVAAARGVFERVGGFDEHFPLAAGEDRELCDRWEESGSPLRYVPRATVRHYHDLTLRRFLRQHFHYGRGAYHFQESRLARQKTPLGIESPAFYRKMLAFPLRQGRRRRDGLLHAGLVGLSQAAGAAGFFYEQSRQRRSRSLSAPLPPG